MKTDFEAMGGSYHWEGDYLIPDVAVPEMPNIGIWGQRRKQYLMDNRKPLYTAMLLSGKINAHLEEIDRSAGEQFERTVERLKQCDGMTEGRKAQSQMKWVQGMNVIYHEATEIVNREVIWT